MKTSSFRDARQDRRYEPHVGDMNHYVDTLNANHDNTVPYVDPDCGGSRAQVLFLLQDPGPKATRSRGGSGFLSVQNDDPTAAEMCQSLAAVGLPWGECLVWNAVPWWVNGNLRVADIRQGLPYLDTVRSLTPDLAGVGLMGGNAEKAWGEFAQRYPDHVHGLTVVPAPHPSVRGLTAGGRQTAEVGRAALRAALIELRDALPVGIA
jgi:hypothetical protein